MGLEIVEENSHNMVCNVYWNLPAFPPDKILRRKYIIASEMHKDAISSLIERDINLAINVIGKDSEVNGLYFLLVSYFAL